MKCILLFTCLLFIMQAQAQVKLENIVKPGTRLIYAVEAEGKKYNFIVTINNLQGTSFSWEMTGQVNISGNITQTAKALDGADKMYNFFQPGDKNLDDETLSVWLSQKCYNQFDEQAGKPIKMYLHGPDKDAEMMGTYTGSQPLEITIDGNPVSINEVLVKPLVLTGKDYVPAEGNDDSFSFYSSASFPILLRMNLGFSIVLKEIQTK